MLELEGATEMISSNSLVLKEETKVLRSHTAWQRQGPSLIPRCLLECPGGLRFFLEVSTTEEDW